MTAAKREGKTFNGADRERLISLFGLRPAERNHVPTQRMWSALDSLFIQIFIQISLASSNHRAAITFQSVIWTKLVALSTNYGRYFFYLAIRPEIITQHTN